jgi:hypothetical protein
MAVHVLTEGAAMYMYRQFFRLQEEQRPAYLCDLQRCMCKCLQDGVTGSIQLGAVPKCIFVRLLTDTCMAVQKCINI